MLGVSNGETGTIIAIRQSPATVSVKIDGGARVTIPLRDYEDIRLGYAITTHKGQGTTVNNSYVLVGGSMQDREIATSRCREPNTTPMFILTDKRREPN